MNTVAMPLNPAQRGERLQLPWTLAALAAMALPHALHLAPWVLLVAAFIALWRLASLYRRWPLPHRYVLLALGVLAFFAVYGTYHTLNGVEAGTALLILLAALKLMEARKTRDYFLLLVIALFIGIANFLYDQTIPLMIYMIPAVWLAVTALLNIAHPDPERPLLMGARTAGRLLLPALPLAAVLFLLFPRVPGPLWGIGFQRNAGVTGLTTHMSPGSLSQLAQSDAIAFRVKFLDAVPAPAQRYWRALVLHDYDGETWTIGDVPYFNHAPRPEIQGAAMRYQLTLEPNDLRVLYALDLPVDFPNDTRLTADYEIVTSAPVTERRRYTVTSYTDYAYGADQHGYWLKRDLYLPRNLDPRARMLAADWRDHAASPAQIVNDALAYFHTQPFHYTLTPGALRGDNRIDQFLFDSRRGFCEHYAGAFVFLMRAAGIPAHVVIGYQGGNLNPLDGYYVVRQEDAHAWAEVWLENRGWVRVDPTAAVDPARVDQGLAAAVPGSDVPGYLFRQHLWLGQLRNTWDAFNNGWNQWVLAYGPELQKRFYTRVGLDYGNWMQLALVLFGILGGILLSVWLVLWWRHRPPLPDPVARDYLRFCRRLAKLGLQRLPHEGPLDYMRRASRLRPDLAAQMNLITGLYIQLRYAEIGDAALLRQRVAAFRPRYRAQIPD